MENFEKRATYNKLKEWLADPPSTVDVHHKYMRPYAVPNIQNWALSTNKENAIALEPTDRRFWIGDCDIPRPAPAYFVALWHWLAHEKGFEACVGWLLDRDVRAFNPKAPPPLTAAKSKMIMLARPATQSLCSHGCSAIVPFGGSPHGGSPRSGLRCQGSLGQQPLYCAARLPPVIPVGFQVILAAAQIGDGRPHLVYQCAE
jgi:hypothetical protein